MWFAHVRAVMCNATEKWCKHILLTYVTYEILRGVLSMDSGSWILGFGFGDLVTVVPVVRPAAVPKGGVDLPKGECVA